MGNQFFVLARKQVDDRYFYHRVATGLLFHRGTGHANQYLSRQRRIVDMHVELEQLVLGFSGYAFACQVDAVSHVQQLVYTRYFYDVGFIVDEIGIGFEYPYRWGWSWRARLSLLPRLLRLRYVPCSCPVRNSCR